MKKILFILPYYKLGGTLTSFINLIPLIDKTNYEIDVFALTNDFDNSIILPDGVNYLGLSNDDLNHESSSKSLKKRLISILKGCKRVLLKVGYDPSDIVFKKMASSLSNKYDIVIAYQEGQPTRMAQYILAPSKIAWIHSEYSRFKDMNTHKAIAAYNYFDKIVCVSYTAAMDMINCEPQWKDKIHVVYNAVDRKRLNDLSKGGVAFTKGINLVSIGRIDSVKRFSHIPIIAKSLKNNGLAFDWWVIGGIADAEEYNRLQNGIKQYDVADSVHTLGPLSNPYPYILSSDLLICLSSSETFNYTIAEAKAIGTPIISTDFPCSYEFIEHEKTGLICPIDKVADCIMTLLVANKPLYNMIKQNLIDSSITQLNTEKQLKNILNNE